MENKQASSFIFGIIAIIVGSALYKEFDFENLKFKNIGLGIIYLVVFAFSVYILVKNYKNRVRK